MQNGRVEVDRVVSLQHKFVTANLQRQRSLEKVKEFHARVVVWLLLGCGHILKVGQIRAELAFGGPLIQALEVIRHIRCARTLGEAHSFLPSHDPDNPPLAIVGEEVVQTHPEHHRDA